MKQFNAKDYIEFVDKTAVSELYLGRVQHDEDMRFYPPHALHAILGIISEVDEFLYAIAKYDTVNAEEELGDLIWFSTYLVTKGIDTTKWTDDDAVPGDDFLNRLLMLFDSTEHQEKHVILEHLSGTRSLLSQAAELADMAKKCVVYDKPAVKVFDGINDRLLHMLNIAFLHYRTVRGKKSFEEIIGGNVEKLSKRYPLLKFTLKDAVERKDKSGG